MSLSKDKLDKVNLFRNNNINQDIDFTIYIWIIIREQSSTISPFCRLFHFGANAKENWYFNNIYIKPEAIIDCLKCLGPYPLLVFKRME